MKIGEQLSIVLVIALIFAMIGGFFVMRGGSAMAHGSELNFQKAVFVVTNAATLSGFQLTVNVNDEDYRPLGKNTILMLIVAGSLVSLLVGGWALNRILKLPYDDLQIAQWTLVIYVLAVVIGANLLIDKNVKLEAAFFNAASAFGNAGQWIGGLPDYTSWRAHLMLLPLAAIGGLGIPVLCDCFSGLFARRRVHAHTYAVLLMSATIYLVGMVLIAGLEYSSGYMGKSAALLGSVEALNSRSLGMPLGSFAMLSRPSQWVVLVLMLIGASPAGTGGGIKGTTLYVLVRDPVRLLFGRPISPALGLACLWLVAYLLVTFLATLILIWAYPQVQSDRLLFLIVSAITNTGTSQEPVTLTGDGLYILTAAMLFGRFAPLALLWTTAKLVKRDVDVMVG